MSKNLSQTPIKEWAAREFQRAKSEKRVTQADLGKALKISQPQARSLIFGSRKISADEIPVLEKFFGTSFSYSEPIPGDAVPLISWVSAGALSDTDAVSDFKDYPTVQSSDLPVGNWIALRVDGSSMNKISPPDSIIFVDLDDKQLVPNRPYIISDETGQATYKRYEPEKEPQFQPCSYKEIEPPALEGAIKVVGRVKRSMIDT